MTETKVTSKFQTTIPREVRKLLDIKPGKEVEWYIIKNMIVVDMTRKMKQPVEFLTTQLKVDLDAVKLVRESREEFK